jgi:hypothetical protein
MVTTEISKAEVNGAPSGSRKKLIKMSSEFGRKGRGEPKQITVMNLMADLVMKNIVAIKDEVNIGMQRPRDPIHTMHVVVEERATLTIVLQLVLTEFGIAIERAQPCIC